MNSLQFMEAKQDMEERYQDEYDAWLDEIEAKRIQWCDTQHHNEWLDNGMMSDSISYAVSSNRNIVAWVHYHYTGGTCYRVELVGYVDGERVYHQVIKYRKYCRPMGYKLHLVTQRIEDNLKASA